MRRLLISALVAALVLSAGPVFSGAAGDAAAPVFSDLAGHEAENELSMLGALGVFSGEEGVGGPVRPDDPITRAGFCKLVVEAFGKGGMAAALMGLRPDFADEVPAWAWGYVNVASYMQIIRGYEDGTFRADEAITYGQAVTMLVRAVSGHQAQVGSEPWPYNYIFYAVDKGFTGDVDVSFASLPCTRGDMALMLLATMQVPQLNPAGATVADSAALDDRLFAGVFKGYNAGSAQFTVTTAAGDVALDAADPVYLIGAEDYDALLGLDVLAVLDGKAAAGGECVFLGVTEDANTFAGVFKGYIDTADADTIVDSYQFDDDTVVPFTTATLVKVNGATPATDSPDELARLLQAGDECFVMLGSDGKASNVGALRFDIVTATSTGNRTYLEDVTPSSDTTDTVIEDAEGSEYSVPKTITVTLDGKVIDRDELAAWDVVKLATTLGNSTPDSNTYDQLTNPLYAVRAVRQVVQGAVETTRVVYPGDILYITIGGVEYEADQYYVSVPNPTDVARYAVDHDGVLLAEIDLDDIEHVVYLWSFSEGTDDCFVTVDLQGEEVTIRVPDDSDLPDPSEVATFQEMELDAVTGEVDYLDVVDFWGRDVYDILAVDPVTALVTAVERDTDGSDYVFIREAPVAYIIDNGAVTYVAATDIGVWQTRPGYSLDFDDDSAVDMVRYHVNAPIETLTVGGSALPGALTAGCPTAWYRFAVTEGQTYTIETGNLGPGMDTYLRLFDENNVLLARNDDGGVDLASKITYTFTYTGWAYGQVIGYDEDDVGTYDVVVYQP